MMIRQFAGLLAIGVGVGLYMAEAVEGADLPGGAEAPATTTVAGQDAPVQGADKPLTKDADAILSEAGFEQVEGDPGLNYAMSFLASNGFTADSPAVAAAFEGDFGLLKAELAKGGFAGWEQAVGLAEQSYGNAQKAEEAKASEVGKIVTEFAEQNGVDWEQAVQHVAGSAKPEERTALNTLLRDPATAHIAAGYITSAFLAADGTEVQPQAKAASQAAVGGGGGNNAPLSRQEYTQEMRKLRESLGEDYVTSPQAAALYRRLA